MFDRLRIYFAAEPARVISAVVAVIAGAASVAGVALDLPSAVNVVTVVLTVLLGGAATRSRVVPHTGQAALNSDDLLPEALR